MSIIRIGLSETKNFREGYASIFGDKKKKDEQPEAKETKDAKEPADKKKATKKKGKK